MRVEAVKLAQAVFGDFLTDTRVNRLKPKREDNILLIQSLKVPDT